MRVSHFAKCETALKVIAKDGSKANGEVRGVRKRIAAAIALLAAILASVIAFWGGKQSVDPEGDVVLQTAQGPIISRIATPLTRQTIPGDRSRLENLPHKPLHTCRRVLSRAICRARSKRKDSYNGYRENEEGEYT